MGVCGACFLWGLIKLLLLAVYICIFILKLWKNTNTLRAVYMKYYFLLVDITKYSLLNNLLATMNEASGLYFLSKSQVPNYIFLPSEKVCCIWHDCNTMNVWFNYITLVSKRVIPNIWGGLFVLYMCSVGIKCISKSNLIVFVWIKHYCHPSRANVCLQLFIILVSQKLYVIILINTLLKYK